MSKCASASVNFVQKVVSKTTHTIDTITIDNTIANMELEFNRLWSLYPKKEKRKEASNHFIKDYKKDSLVSSKIELALNNYKKHLAEQKTEYRFIMMGGTFFYNWGDWVNPSIKQVKYKSTLLGAR